MIIIGALAMATTAGVWKRASLFSNEEAAATLPLGSGSIGRRRRHTVWPSCRLFGPLIDDGAHYADRVPSNTAPFCHCHRQEARLPPSSAQLISFARSPGRALWAGNSLDERSEGPPISCHLPARFVLLWPARLSFQATRGSFN